MASPKDTLRALGRPAKKGLGQHFLAREDVATRIADLAHLKPGDRVLEIGPGLGILTRALLATGALVTAVELDRELAERLRRELPSVRVVEGDASRLDWSAVCGDEGWSVVANLPYNVGTTLVVELIKQPARFLRLTVMLQKEVVERLAAAPGSKIYGALSVQVQARARVSPLLSVPPSAFFPPPKVDSLVVRLEPHATPDFGGVGGDAFDRVVRAAFAQRRKKIRNSLSALFAEADVTQALDRAGIDPGARAEVVPLEAYRKLAAALASGRDPSETTS